MQYQVDLILMHAGLGFSLSVPASALHCTHAVQCQSVELWQGQERSAIIISTVRGSASEDDAAGMFVMNTRCSKCTIDRLYDAHALQ